MSEERPVVGRIEKLSDEPAKPRPLSDFIGKAPSLAYPEDWQDRAERAEQALAAMTAERDQLAEVLAQICGDCQKYGEEPCDARPCRIREAGLARTQREGE